VESFASVATVPLRYRCGATRRPSQATRDQGPWSCATFLTRMG